MQPQRLELDAEKGVGVAVREIGSLSSGGEVALKAVGRAMAAMPGVAIAAAVTGPHNLHAVVHCRDLDDLFEFTTDRVGALPGVESLEVRLVSRQVKQVGTRIVGDRLT